MFGIKSPNLIKEVKAKYSTVLCPPGFAAITLFGIIFTRSKGIEANINQDSGFGSVTEYHEWIHIQQAKNTHNSWLLYYLLYIWQWITNLPLVFVSSKAPYKFISYELEAFAFQKEWNYINPNSNGCDKWRAYNKLTLKKKFKYAKHWKKIGGDFGYYVRYTINEEENI